MYFIHYSCYKNIGYEQTADLRNLPRRNRAPYFEMLDPPLECVCVCVCWQTSIRNVMKQNTFLVWILRITTGMNRTTGTLVYGHCGGCRLTDIVVQIGYMTEYV